MNAIVMENITKRFANRTAVNHLSLTIEQGEMFALLGQNGAGKTTAIRMLCGLLRPSEGDAILMGHSVCHEPEAVKQVINLSPQETAVAPKLSVRENLELIARLYGADCAQARQKAERLLQQFHLQDRAREKARTLSGGMQRRLSIAMALISDPAVLFLDEPTLGLDVRARRDLWKQIEQLKGRMTILLTTHYLEEAEALADRIAIMDRGELQAVGTAEQIKRQTGAASLEEAFLCLTEEEGVEQ